MIKQLELEITTACNAACPQCSRNFYGGPQWPTVPNLAISLTWLQEKVPLELLKNLELIRFCGTYGDPCMHPDLIDMIFWLKSVSTAKIVISTNGGMRSTKWWKNLAEVMDQNDRVIFGIDGLNDTNHIYRRNVDFDKVINHAREFIVNGGQAVWQFLVFEHNQHQTKQAQKLSQELKFVDFIIKQTTRFVDKQHQFVDHVPVLDNKKIFFLKLPSDRTLVNQGYKKYRACKPDYTNVKIDCIAKRLELLYIGADGYVFPCGFLADRLYGFESENHSDYHRMQDLFEEAGGAHTANLNHTSLDNIINGSWFNTIYSSWNNNKRLERCAHQCGIDNTLVTQIYSYMRGVTT
jgi:hypothetical protein